MTPQIISFNCILKNLTGRLLSSTFNKDVLTSINDDHAMLLGLAKGLQGLQKGDKRKIQLSAEEAYGFYDPKKIVYFPRKKLVKDVKIGETVTIVGKSGKSRAYKIVALSADLASLDSNHPLAGQDLIFEIEALAVRDATVDEIDAANNNVSVQLLH